MKLFILGLLLTFTCFANNRLRFAEDLIDQGDLFRALTVLKEVEFGSRGNKEGYQAQKKILKIHLESQEFEGFDFQVSQLLENYSSLLKVFNKQEIQAETFFLIGNHSKAFHEIYSLETSLEKKYLFRAYAESDQELSECNTPTCERIMKIERKMLLARNTKNEYLALGLGIIPGMGQIYAGNTGSGIATFILNGFFIATSVIAFNNNETAMGFASSIVGSTFYFSSIYAGYETARRYNISKSKIEKRKLADIPFRLDLMNIIFE